MSRTQKPTSNTKSASTTSTKPQSLTWKEKLMPEDY